ncbi:MAG: hypothetical protein AABY05_00390 [Nanoarchaeota archaeon]
MKEEIYYGLKNAIEKNESLDSAMQSFINAGYNPEEVKAAGKAIEEGENDFKDSSLLPKLPDKKSLPQLPKIENSFAQGKQPEIKKKGKKKTIILLIILLLLIFLGAIAYLLYTLIK